MNSNLLAVIFVLVPLLAALLAVAFLLRRQRRAAQSARMRLSDVEKRQRQAIWGGATVINIRRPPQAGEALQASGRLRVELRLEINVPSGQPYQAATAWLIDAAALPQVQPGQALSVKIDAQDQQVIYPNAGWAEFIPWN